jgi:cyanophycin synthetase
MGGAARHNVANALAAAGGALALGASRAEVAAGLRSFRPTSGQMPGRLNFYRLGNRVVLVDFAHNAAGLGVVLDMVDALIGKRGRRRRATLSTIVGTAGDRPDDGLRAVGRLAGARSDQVAIKETLHYLRGRTRQSVIGELRAGLREGGVRVADVPVYVDEVSAVHGELTTTGRLAADEDGAHWLLLMCHEARDPVTAELQTLGARPVSDVAEIVTKPDR